MTATPTETETLPSIADEEFAERAVRLQELVAREALDLLLVNSSESDFANVRYLSDYWPVFEAAGVVVPPDGPLTLLIGPESETFALDRSRIPRVRKLTEYRESADPEYPDIAVDTYASVFEEAGVPAPRRIGLAGAFATNYVMLESLRAGFPDAELVRADHLLTRLRSVKSEAELACLRAAFRISERAIARILEELRPGRTELQLVGVAQESIYEQGAEYEGMVQYVMSGPNSRHAISRASHRRLREGEVVQLNISARVAGYSSGVGRPVGLGRLRDDQREVLEFGLAAHRATASWLRAGVTASDVAKRYRAYFSEHGRDDLFLYGPCHGLGLIEVEPPWMEETSHYPLERDMTFQIDSFVVTPEFGARWENGARILDDGIELFSNERMQVLEVG
ncbi:MAG TPA: Xaa-Pro peptidase family protein [Gaiellaceae bacterium]